MIKIIEVKENKKYSAYPDMIVTVEWNPTKKESQIDHFRVSATDSEHMYIELDRDQQSYIGVSGSFYHVTGHFTKTGFTTFRFSDRIYMTRAGSFSIYDNVPKTHKEKLESLFESIVNEVYRAYPELFTSAELRTAKGQISILEKNISDLQAQIDQKTAELEIAKQRYDLAIIQDRITRESSHMTKLA